jgi:hypothetical protein
MANGGIIPNGIKFTGKSDKRPAVVFKISISFQLINKGE